MHVRYLTLAAGTAALAIGQSAGAVEEVGQAYVTPMGTYFKGDSERGVEDGVKGGVLGIGYAIEERWNIELQAQYLAIDGNNGGASGHQTGFTANALNVYNRGGTVEPYLIGGVGMNSQHNVNSRDSGNFQAQAGAGLMATLIPHRLGARLEALWRLDDASSNFNDFILHFGFQVPIGSPKAAAVAAPVAAAAAVPVAAAAAPDVDTDGDGVVDRLDKCPNTPRGARVDATGCPLDSDGDGVYDGIDQCPNTPKGSKVDEKGCVNTIELPGVNFENDSARLKPESSAILDKAIATLKADPAIEVEVQGHTDNKASAPYNLKLSQKRAETVRNYLIKGGIAASRLTAKGYGLTQPVADNATADGRAKNRRVALKVTKQ